MKSKYFILIWLFVLAINDVYCQEITERDTELKASQGETKVIGRGVSGERDVALKLSFEDAINQAIGVLINSTLVVENEDLIKDEIITMSRGFISKYKIISEKEKDGKYTIVIIALVTEKQVYETLASKGIKVEYNASGLFKNIDNYKIQAEKELRFIHSYIENLKLLDSEWGKVYDFSLEISDPVFEKATGNFNREPNLDYKVSITIHLLVIKENLSARMSHLEEVIEQTAYEKVELKNGMFDPNEDYRQLSNHEILRLRLQNSDKRYLDIFEKEFSPYVIIVKKGEGCIFYKYLSMESINAIKIYSSQLFNFVIPFGLKINFNGRKTFYGQYQFQNTYSSQSGIVWFTNDPVKKVEFSFLKWNKSSLKENLSKIEPYYNYRNSIYGNSFQPNEWAHIAPSPDVLLPDSKSNIYKGITYFNFDKLFWIDKLTFTMKFTEEELRTIQNIEIQPWKNINPTLK